MAEDKTMIPDIKDSTKYQPYIDGKKELREINAEYIAGRVKG